MFTYYFHPCKHGKELWVLTLHHQPTRIVVKIVLPVVQLIFVQENLIAVAFFEQTISWWFVHFEQFPIGIVASRFESCYYFPKMLTFSHVLIDPYNHVYVVWHDT